MPEEIELRSLYLETHIPTADRWPVGRAAVDPIRPEVMTRPLPAAELPAPARYEAPLLTFTQSLAVAGTFRVAVAGNFLRYNASIGGGGADRVTVRVKNGGGDTSHSALSFYPGQRMRGRTFTELEIVVPVAIAGAVAEFIYTTLNPDELAPDFV